VEITSGVPPVDPRHGNQEEDVLVMKLLGQLSMSEEDVVHDVQHAKLMRMRPTVVSILSGE